MADAVIMLRKDPHYRREAFCDGLAALGYKIKSELTRPQPDDVLVVWNRYGDTHNEAARWTECGATVIVAENGYLGRDWRGSTWYALALRWHMGRGDWNVGDLGRALALFDQPAPWAARAGPVVILGQRGIGAPKLVAPGGWTAAVARDLAAQRIPALVREHPGNDPDQAGLTRALAQARAAITWSSGAGIKAILAGVPVYYGMQDWIGAPGARAYARPLPEPFVGDRWPMLHRIAWAMWELKEIADGRAFNHLLRRPEETLFSRSM